MKKTGNGKLENQHAEKKSNVLLIEGDKENVEGSSVEPDERFFMDEPDEKNEVKDEPEKKPEKVMGKGFKKQIKKENRKNKIAFAKKKFSNFFRLATVSSLFRLLDFLLNVFSIASIIFGVIVTAHFLMEGNPYMVASGCVFIFIVIYLNEKIS